MDGPDPLTIVLRPTKAFAEMHGPVLLRAWRGVVEGEREPVVALVASVRADASNIELSHPMPIEAPDLTELATQAMGRLIRVLNRLQPAEVEAIAALAELVTGHADSEHHRDSAGRFCRNVLRIIDKGGFW